MKNKAGRIVSKAKHNTAKREKRLVKAGFFTKKGHFGFVKKTRGGSAAAPAAVPATPSTSTDAVSLAAANAAIKDTLVARHPTTATTSSSSTTAKTGGRRRRKRGTRRYRGGAAYPLSPAPYHGKGIGTSGRFAIGSY